MIDFIGRQLIAERLQVIEERKAALQRWANAPEGEKVRINSEFINPLNKQLIAINRRLGL